MDLTNIKINGRYSMNNNSLFLYNGGSGISFKMQGKSFTVSIISHPNPGYFYIIIDRNLSNKIKVLSIGENYTYSFCDDRPHLVDIVKANECNDNALEIKDLSIQGTLLNYDHIYDKKVIVYGDSTISGYGILEHTGQASLHNSDAVRNFVFSGLYELNMDMDVFSAAGYGLAFSLYTCPQNIGVYDFFEKVGVHKNISWDVKPCDLLIISLGCNDNSLIQDDPTNKEERIQEFERKYEAIIFAHILKNPYLKVLMIYGTLLEESAYYLYEQTYNYLKVLFKDIYIHKFSGDKSAIENHAYVDAHEQMKEELKNVINEIL